MQRVSISKVIFILMIAALAACGGGTDNSSKTNNSVPVFVDPMLSSTSVKLIAGMTIGIDAWNEGSTGLGGHGSTVDGVNCLVTEDYHVHAHLSIIKNGQALAIPANIGLTGCAYELHTHDKSGIIHVETSAYHLLTLGQFFAVWGQPLTSTNVAGIVNLPINVYVNDDGKLTLYKGDPASIELTNHREITIVMGTLMAQIPTYTWDAQL